MHERVKKINHVLSGRASDQTMARYILTAMACYLAGMIIAMLAYQGGFTFDGVYTSYLGAPDHNPTGWWIYNVSELVAGTMLVPAFIYAYRKLGGAMKILSMTGCLFGMTGAAGLALLGIYFQGADPDGHRVATILAFGGFGVAALLLLPVLVVLVTRRAPRARWWHVTATYGALIMLVVLAVVFDPVLNDKEVEWLYTFAAITWLVGCLSFTVVVKTVPQPSS